MTKQSLLGDLNWMQQPSLLPLNNVHYLSWFIRKIYTDVSMKCHATVAGEPSLKTCITFENNQD